MQLRNKILAAVPAAALVLSGAAAWAGATADDPNPTLPSAPAVPGAPALPGLPAMPALPAIPEVPASPALPGTPALPIDSPVPGSCPTCPAPRRLPALPGAARRSGAPGPADRQPGARPAEPARAPRRSRLLPCRRCPAMPALSRRPVPDAPALPALPVTGRQRGLLPHQPTRSGPGDRDAGAGTRSGHTSDGLTSSRGRSAVSGRRSTSSDATSEAMPVRAMASPRPKPVGQVAREQQPDRRTGHAGHDQEGVGGAPDLGREHLAVERPEGRRGDPARGRWPRPTTATARRCRRGRRSSGRRYR